MADADEALFRGFRQVRLRTRETEIHAVVGGDGPPVLLLHGYPETHACWHRVAPALASRFTVVCPDLRGYGDSGRPASDPAHRAYSKRAMARDQLEVMAQLGFERFSVVGHDRGGRVAYRLALDEPERVTRLAVLDIVPTLDTWAGLDRKAGLVTYHWFFLAQRPDLPERLIGADPDYFLRWTLDSWAGRSGAFAPRALGEYRRAFRDPDVIRATCEDYRAGATVDVEDDDADRGARRIRCPVLALWAEDVAEPGWDPIAIWRDWAPDVRGQAVPCGHFLPEEAPAETLAALRAFHAPGRAVSQRARRRMPNMLTAATAILTISSPILVVLGLLSLAAWRDRRREAVVARQIRLTDALAEELGAIVAPVVAKRFGGPWRVGIHVPVGRPALVSRIVAIAHDTLTRASTTPYELVLIPETPPVRPLPVITRPTRRLQAA